MHEISLLWKKGKFTSAWRLYGYRKSEEDHHQLIVDEEAAEHLKSIFSMYMDGRNYSDIARQLNKDGVLSPTLQRKFYKTGEKPLPESKPWNNYEVKRVLQEVHCTGDSVYGKFQYSVFQGNKQRNRPENEWLHVENTHEGIIDRELFQKVQSKIQEYMEAYKKKHQQNNGAIRNHNFYTGKIWCGGCGNRMTLSRERNGRCLCGFNYYPMYSLDLSKKISSAMQTRTKNGTRLPVNARYGYKKGKDGRLEVDPEAAKVVKMIFQMAAEGTSFADITRELNRQAIVTCDGQKLSRGDQVQFQRFDTIKKKHWSATTVAAIVRDEIYIGTRIWGKTRCSMHTGHKAVLNDETEWVRLENHHTAIIDRELFEKANEMHPKKKRSVAESRTNFTLERRKKQPALLICANCGHSLLKETEHLLKCSDARTNGDPVCRSLVIRREPMEENILGLVRQYAASMLKKGKKVSSKRQCEYKEINTTELQKQSRQLTSERMKLYDDYKDGRIDRDSYKQRAEKISVQLDEIKRKIEDAKNSKKLLEQNELSDKIKLKDFLGIQKFDTEKLREIIKVVRVHSQDEIEIEWNFDDIFSEQR